jgi:hypothetical protein
MPALRERESKLLSWLGAPAPHTHTMCATPGPQLRNESGAAESGAVNKALQREYLAGVEVQATGKQRRCRRS